jgi:hypothetical protein
MENYSDFAANKTHRQKMGVCVWEVLKFTLSWLCVNLVGPEANYPTIIRLRTYKISISKLVFSVSIFIS